MGPGPGNTLTITGTVVESDGIPLSVPVNVIVCRPTSTAVGLVRTTILEEVPGVLLMIVKLLNVELDAVFVVVCPASGDKKSIVISVVS